MENVQDAMNRTLAVVNELVNRFPKFKRILSSFVDKSREGVTLYENYIGSKYFKITIEAENMVENGYNNSSKSHTSYIDENGDLHFVLYESIFRTEVCFAKGDEKGLSLYNAYMAITTVPSKESAKMFKEALEAY